eukprot:scaffold2642_cov183-Ochromonas_danica.AAC.11
MDFSDITRSGTAPASKGKAYLTGFPSMGNVRPKTRAVDNDIQDTNSELRANRVKGNSGSSGLGGPLHEVLESVISNLSEIGELDGPATGGSGGSGTSSGAGAGAGAGGGGGGGSNIRRDLPSRSRPSKDPRRVNGTNNLLNGSSISAYTQNIPNIVLNTTKKPNKPLSASGLRSKDPKNINQLNELRAAYGADIPLGKAEKLLSPPRPKSMRGQQQQHQQQPPPPASRTQMNSSSGGVDRPVRSSKSNPMGGSGNGGVGSMPIPIPIPSHATSNGLSSQQSSPIHSPDTPVSGLKLVDPIVLHNPVTVTTTAATTTRRASIEEEKDYSKDLQVKSSNTTNRNTVCSTSQGSRGKSTSFTSKALLKSSLVTNRGNNTSPASLPVSTNHHDSNAFLEVVERSSNEKTVIESTTAAVIASVNTARKATQGQSSTTCVDSPPHKVEEEEKLVKSRDYSNSSNKMGINSVTLKGTPLPPPMGMELQLPDDLGYASPDCDGELDEECPMISDDEQGRPYNNSRHIYPSINPPMINRPAPIDCDDDDNNNMQMPERPTSRKLYLGSDKKTEKAVSKAPRSAGARFGHVSPISGGIDLDKIPQPRSPQVRNYMLKKNGSFNDVQQNRRWLEEEQEGRPPSRQSSAFPVHLADAPSTGCTVSTAGSSCCDQNGAGSEEKSPLGGELIVASSPARIAAEQACLDDYDVEESLVIDDTMVDTTIGHHDSSIVPNLEPISVKKTRSSGDEESISSSSSPGILRPPSRQKLAAQHLFDGRHKPPHPVLEDHVSIDRWNKTEGEARRSSGSLVNSTVDSNLKPNTTASGRLRSLRTATRAGGGTSNGYDPSRDGFTDLDGGDNNVAPFVFTVSYGTEDPTQRRHVSSHHGPNKMIIDEEEFRSSDVSNESLLRKSIISASPSNTTINTNTGNTNNMTTSNMTMVNNNNNNSNNNNGIPALGNKKLDNNVINSIPFPAPVRPKSVSAMDPSPWVHQVSRPGRVTKLSSSGNTGVGESEALRSKSASLSHHHHHTALHNHPSSQVTHVKPLHHDGGMTMARQSPVSSTGAWSEGYEANNTAPRAKANSGWTSPSLLAQTGAQYVNPSSSLSTFSQDHQEAFYNRDEEDDGTIWTDEESGAHFEHDMSMQSFQLESSLGEDFLSLFAPAGR